MAILAVDNFQRANGPLGANWTAQTGNALSISSDTVIGAAGFVSSYYNATTPPANQFGQLTLVTAPTGSDFWGPTLRMTASSTSVGYMFYAAATQYGIWIATGTGAGSVLATFSQQPVNGDIIKGVISGTTLKMYVNGISIITYSDSTYSSGSAGIYGAGTTGAMNGFEIGDLLAPSPSSINVASGARGTTSVITVSGTEFDSNGGATLSFSGTGVTVNSYSVQNATTITASITIAANAPLGAQNVTVTNASDSQTGTLSGAFTVTAASGGTPFGSPGVVPNLHLTYIALKTTSNLNNVDGVQGSSTVVIPNQGEAVTVTAAQGLPQPGAYGTIHGRIGIGTTASSILNNPA